MNTLPLPIVEEISIDELLSALPACYRLDLAFMRKIDQWLAGGLAGAAAGTGARADVGDSLEGLPTGISCFIPMTGVAYILPV